MNAIKEARYNLAIAYLNDAQYNEAIPEFEAVIKLDADFVDAHCGLSRAYLELHDLDKAETSAQKALSLNSEYPSALSLIDELKNAYYERGIESFNDKHYGDAVSLFEKVTLLDSNYKYASYNLGRAYIGLRLYDDAITALQSAIDHNLALDDVHYHIGLAHIEQEQFDKAIQHLEQAINTDPNLKDAHYNLACAYRVTGNLEAATNAVTETLRLDPDYKPVHELVEKIKQTHYNRGKSYLNNSRYSDAIAAFQNVITLDADFTAAHYNLGVAYLKLENFTRSVEVLQKTIDLDRTHKAAFHALALAYFGLHELENARNAAIDALKIDPNYQPAKSLLEAIDPDFTNIATTDTTETEDTATEKETDISKTKPSEQDESDTPSTTEESGTTIEDKSEIQKDLERGLVFLSNRQYNNAATAYKKVIKTDPNCIAAHYGLGQTYLEMGALDDAKSAAEDALKLDPRHQPSQELLQAIKYLVNLERNRKKRKRVFTFVSILLVIGIGVFAGWYFFWSVPQPPPPPPPLPSVFSIQYSLEGTGRSNIIYAGESCIMKLIIKNSGGPSDNVRLHIESTPVSGLKLTVPKETFVLRPDSSKKVVIQIGVEKTVGQRDITLQIHLIDEKNKRIATKDAKFRIRLRPDIPDIK